MNVVGDLGLGASPQQDEYDSSRKACANSSTPCLLLVPMVCVFASNPNNNECSGKVAASLCTALSTGSVARPLVSPWKEASRYLRPSTSSAAITRRSPEATGTDLSKADMTEDVWSTILSSLKNVRRSSSTEF